MLNRPNMGFPEVEHLDEYYRDCVIGGPAAFMIPIRERDQFIDAIRTKILLEVALAPPRSRCKYSGAGDPGAQCEGAGKRPAFSASGMWQQRWGN